ncbi:MAG TPA: hypothetical protein VHN99_03095 [Deinococcales bacterium]|nr:hypothetical protein [Deinococcales bacterium]
MKPIPLILVVLLVLLGLGALFGGAALMLAPDGSPFGMPRSMLDRTPFTSFLIPGLLLFLVNGVFPLVTAYGLARRPRWTALDRLGVDGRHWADTTAALQGLALIVWTGYEFFCWGPVAVVLGYMALGVVLLALAAAPALLEDEPAAGRPGRARPA